MQTKTTRRSVLTNAIPAGLVAAIAPASAAAAASADERWLDGMIAQLSAEIIGGADGRLRGKAGIAMALARDLVTEAENSGRLDEDEAEEHVDRLEEIENAIRRRVGYEAQLTSREIRATGRFLVDETPDDDGADYDDDEDQDDDD